MALLFLFFEQNWGVTTLLVEHLGNPGKAVAHVVFSQDNKYKKMAAKMKMV